MSVKKPSPFKVALAAAEAARSKDGAGEESDAPPAAPDWGGVEDPIDATDEETDGQITETGDGETVTSGSVVNALVNAAPDTRLQPPLPEEARQVALLHRNGNALLPVSSKKMGRPNGKRSDPAYMQMTAYVPRNLHEDMKEELFRVNRDRRRQGLPELEISDVVEVQLSAWLKTQQGEKADV